MAATTRHFYVYIASSISGTLYIGVTNNLHKRIWQHKQGALEGFTKQYEVNRLIYFESFDDIRTAINREKQLKGWSRRKKIWLVERVNPSWEDLSREWYDDRGPSTTFGSAELRSG
jgi:putative endonuclease